MQKKRMRNTLETFIARAKMKHGDIYDYSNTIFTTLRNKVEIVCKDHGSFWQDPLNHINGSGCPACAGCKRTTIDDFITRAKASHGEQYDYSLVEYSGVDSKVTIVCPDHGPFQQLPYDHMKGRGCARCAAERVANARRHSIARFVSEAKAFHGDRFDYSKAIYINSTTPIEIVCPDHGSFWQVPQDHKTRYGCISCAGLAEIEADEFVRRAISTHGDTYVYSKDSYAGYSKPTKIACKKHGDFWQIAKDHANGAGCPKCASERTSSLEERMLADWIESIGEKVDRNNRSVLNGFEIDIYIPAHKIGIEYNGAYWHHDERMAHPRIHETKTRRANALGIRLITVWDFDWKAKPEMIKRHIMHAIGKQSGQKINARQCDVQRVEFDDAQPFYDRTHIQGAPWRAMIHYGLFHGERMVACMSFGQGSSRRGKTGDNEWELMRFATDGLVRGGASKLFKVFVGQHQPEAVWSFSDKQHFSGGLYAVLDFAEDGHVPADYRVVSINKARVWHKSAWKRRKIPARLAELGLDEQYNPDTDPRTERDMQKLAGTVRIMDAGKIRWKWTKENAQQSRALLDAA